MPCVNCEYTVEEMQNGWIDSRNLFAITASEQHLAVRINQKLIVDTTRCGGIDLAGPADGLPALKQGIAHPCKGIAERFHRCGIVDAALAHTFNDQPFCVTSIGAAQNLEARHVDFDDSKLW